MASNELNIKDILRDSENYLLRYRDNWCIYVDMAQQEVLDKLVDRKSWESPELVEGEIPLNLLWSKPRGYKMCVSGCPTTEEKVVQRRFDFLARTKIGLFHESVECPSLEYGIRIMEIYRRIVECNVRMVASGYICWAGVCEDFFMPILDFSFDDPTERIKQFQEEGWRVTRILEKRFEFETPGGMYFSRPFYDPEDPELLPLDIMGDRSPEVDVKAEYFARLYLKYWKDISSRELIEG